MNRTQIWKLSTIRNSSIMIQIRKVIIIITARMTGIIHALNIQYKDIPFIKVYWLCSKHQLVRLNSCFQTYGSFIQTEGDSGGWGISTILNQTFPRNPHHISTTERFTKYACQKRDASQTINKYKRKRQVDK